MKRRVLDLGCGRRKAEGAVGVDHRRGLAADVICDLNAFPYPFRDNQFSRIRCHSILEHLDNLVRVMEELFRIARPGAEVEIVTPHFSSLYSWDDPTHRHHFSSNSFDFFLGGESALTKGRFELLERRILFGRGLWDPLLEPLANRFRHWYERRWAFIFPAFDLQVRLRVVK